jgi:hypothetical protein
MAGEFRVPFFSGRHCSAIATQASLLQECCLPEYRVAAGLASPLAKYVTPRGL